eukprot:202684_1
MDEEATAGFIEVGNADLSRKAFYNTENGSTASFEPTIDLNGAANCGSQTELEDSQIDGLTTAANMREDKLTPDQSSRLSVISPNDNQTGKGCGKIGENLKPQDSIAIVEPHSSKLLISISKPGT